MPRDAKTNGQDSDVQTVPSLPDTSAIERLIRATRKLLRSTWVTTGLGVTVGLLLAALVLVGLIDLALSLWPSFRLAGLLVIVVPTAWVLVIGVVRPLFRRLSAGLIARRIEAELPGIHNRLVSCVDLARAKTVPSHSMAFHHRLASEALERIRNFHPRQVLDLVSLRRAAVFAAVGVVAIMAAMTLFSNRLPTAMARIFQPLADIPPATGVEFTVLVNDADKEANTDMLRGDDVRFKVIITKCKPESFDRDPLRLVVDLPDKEGSPKQQRHELGEPRDGRVSFTLTGMQQSFTYRVYGGQTWSRRREVRMLDRPQIRGIQTVLHWPAYMRNDTPQIGPPLTANVAGPAESIVEVRVDVEGEATEGEIVLLVPQTKTVNVPDRQPRTWFRDAIPLGAKPDGTWEWHALSSQKAHSDPAAEGTHAHGFNTAPTAFKVEPGESLFADVFLPAGQVPEQIMLKWHDGASWEHRAYWGANRIAEGQPGGPSRIDMGPLPQPGQVVRLEVPAARHGKPGHDLSGKRLTGISFTLVGGRAVWGDVGAMKGTVGEEVEFVEVERNELRPVAPEPIDTELDGRPDPDAATRTRTKAPNTTTWAGRFEIKSNGFYRVELRNSSVPSPEMQPAEITTIPDNPPQVVIERPGTDLQLSAPQKVPVYISVYDDFGIDRIVLHVQRDEKIGFEGRPVKSFDTQPRTETAVVTIDLEAEGLKLGQSLTYRVEVRDGKGNSGSTPAYRIQLKDDANAADKKLAVLDDTTDTFRDKLLKLLAQQKKIDTSIRQVEQKFKPLLTKIEIERAKVEAGEVPVGDPGDPKSKPMPKPAEAPKPIKLDLDPEALKQLVELRGEMQKVLGLENENIKLAGETQADLNKLADQAKQNDLLPPDISQQLQALQNAFRQMALAPMQKLSQMLNQVSQPTTNDPQMPAVQKQSEQVKQDLEDLEKRLKLLSEAQERLRNEDIEKMLKELQDGLLEQNMELTARDLADLRDMLKALEKELEALRKARWKLDLLGEDDKLDELLKETRKKIDRDTEAALNKARKVYDREKLKSMKRMPRFPGRPYTPEAKKYPVPPGEQDTPPTPEEIAAMKKAQKDKPEKDPSKKKDDAEEEEEEDEPLFMPGIHDKVAMMDERFKKFLRPVEPGESVPQDPNDEPGKPEQQSPPREMSYQEELQAAAQAAAQDAQALDQLAQMMQGASGQSMSPQQMQELMNSPAVQAAMQMMQRMQEMMAQGQQGQEGQAQGQPKKPQPSNNQPVGLQKPAGQGVKEIETQLELLPPEARHVIIKMQPQQREELLQALREEGPEGYRQFIRDYFRRLTKVQARTPQKK